MTSRARTNGKQNTSPYVQSFGSGVVEAAGKAITTFSFTGLTVEVSIADGTVWAFVRRPNRGGLAVRIAAVLGNTTWGHADAEKDQTARLHVFSALGEHDISFVVDEREHASLRIKARFTPFETVQPPSIPRDIYLLDNNDNPQRTKGTVHAKQRGPNSGLVYLTMRNPAFGKLLYFQNFTSLNAYFEATGTTPIDTVGGEWPELGYLTPVPDSDQPDKALEGGVPVVIYDAILVFHPDPSEDEQNIARHFLQLLGAVYRVIERPPTVYRDWFRRAECTLSDLGDASEATISHYGHRYVHPYTSAEYPDCMVQASIVTALHDWGNWHGAPVELEAELKGGLKRFYDKELKTLRRYLPNVGDDKDADAVDSWYLYHPMLNLGFLALSGDKLARELFLGSIGFAVRAGQHFAYKWPVQYNVTDFSVITDVAEVDGRGQTDVGGIYARVMLQAFELTDDVSYLQEARAAMEAAIGLGFDLNYQANLTAWGAAACMRLWRVTNQRHYLGQSYVFLASFFHNCEIWESQIGFAKHYSNFLGVTCLQDAPYMAMYECFDSFVAFQQFLDDSGPDLDPAARLLVSEYCRYVLHRAWFYFPDALPREAIADKQREHNGYIDRKLSFPLEDLYADGQPAGQVGQEVYGAGAAFIFATRAYHTVEGAPFRIYCDHFVRALERLQSNAVSLTLQGGENMSAGLSIVRMKRCMLPELQLATTSGDIIRPETSDKDRTDFHIPADGRVILTWAELS